MSNNYILESLAFIIGISINCYTLSFFWYSTTEYDLPRIKEILNMNLINFLILQYFWSILVGGISLEISNCIIYNRLPQINKICDIFKYIDYLLSFPSPNIIIK